MNDITVDFELPNQTKITMQATLNMPFNELVSKFKQKCSGSSDLNSNKMSFYFNGSGVNEDTSMKLGSIGLQSNSTITVKLLQNTVSDKEKLAISSRKRQQDMRNNKKGISKVEEVKISQSIQHTLEDMAILGEVMKDKINIEKRNNKYISTNEALKLYEKDNQLFALGAIAKYLESFKILTAIEKETKDISKDDLSNANTMLQFLVNGLIIYRKYVFKFQLPEKRIEELKNNEDLKQKLKEHFCGLIIKKYKNLSIDNLVITPYIDGNNFTFLLLLNSDNLKIEKEKIEEIFKFESELNNLVDFHESPVLDAIILSRAMLDKRGDNKDGGYGQNEKRGGEVYYPPNGWMRVGVKVYGEYDNGNNNWLSYDGRAGEWSICYRGVSNVTDKDKINEDDDDIKHGNKKVGNGTLCYHDPKEMDEKTGVISNNINDQYKLAFMLRVKPEQIRCPKSKQSYWVLNGTPDEIRPYGILIKKCS